MCRSVSHKPRALFARRLLLPIVTLWLCIVAPSLKSATITAASPSYSDVNAAVNQASNGDTVIIPAGTATWSTAFSTSKAITLQGAGTTSGSNLTQINLSLSFGFNVTGVNRPFRLTGIYFNCFDWNHQFCLNFSGPTTQLRVDHCKFKSGQRTLTFGYTSHTSGPCYGVVDHCQFIEGDIMIAVGGYRIGDVKDGDVAWSEPVRPGTAECMVVEDNTFTYSISSKDEDIYCDRGAKVTVRHNTFTYNGPLGLAVDAHGGYGNERGTILYEFYNNTFTMNSYRPCHLRGGTHIFFNNAFNGSIGTAIQLDSDYFDYPTDCYFWSNTVNGAALTAVALGTGILSTGLHVGPYYMHAPQSGQRFYPYTSYTYPHPLVSGAAQSPTPSPTPTPPSTPTPPPTPTPTPLGLSFNSTEGTVTSPFAVNSDNSISQASDTDDPQQGGKAAYGFSVTSAGDYTILSTVNCPDGGSNSFFVDLDGEPVATMVWQVPVTSGFESRAVTWSGSTTPRFWTLPAGIHQLVIRGREANAKIKSISLVLRPSPPASPQIVTGN